MTQFCANADKCRFHDPDEAAEALEAEQRPKPTTPTHATELLTTLEAFFGVSMSMEDAFAFEEALKRDGFSVVRESA